MEEVVLSATLKEHEGFVYLAIPNVIVDVFAKIIPDRGISKPEIATEPKQYVGAHVSVMYAEETKKFKKRVREVGENFSFTLGKMYKTSPQNWDGVEEVYFIAVNSPELEWLRRKYGLKPKLKYQDFHITVACRVNRNYGNDRTI